MPIAEALYDLGMRAGRALLPRTPFLPDKLRRGIVGRRGLMGRIDAWAKAERSEGPLAWFHAPSVGEGLQTEPVIEALRELRPEVQVVYTFFSPSAERFARGLPVDYADYMPFDTAPDVAAALDRLEPSVVVFGKSDVWPNLTRAAVQRRVPLVLVSATLPQSSSRMGRLARLLLEPAYARLDAVGAISKGDAERLVELGVASERVKVTGDARFDQVVARARSIDRSRPPVSILTEHQGMTLVAGSTWPKGERHLIPVVAALSQRHGALRLIVAPHEPTPSHLAELEWRLSDVGLASVRLSKLEEGEPPERAVVVDRVGVLGEIYAVADAAYVGGGFGTRGLHSVLEPAALGVPVLYGPNHQNAREAAELMECGGGREVRDGEALERALDLWLGDPEARRSAGAAAAAYVEGNLGAGRRNAELVLELLPR